jgi:hypothetical protein
MFAVAANNVPGSLIDLFHGIQVAIMLALMTNILQFAWWKCKAKKNIDGHWNRYGPCYLLMLATVLVLIQPTCMLVIGAYGDDDDCFKKLEGSAENTDLEAHHHGMVNFFFEGDDTNSLVPDTTVGWMIQVFGTYLGFICMFTGVVWSTNLHKKISKKWAIIQANRRGLTVQQ